MTLVCFVFPFCKLKFILSYSLPALTNCFQLFLPFTFILPKHSCFFFISHSCCCLNCLSGSIRLSKQRCCTVPACYKYLWCASPFIPHPSSPFQSLWGRLFSFFIVSFLFAEIRGEKLLGSCKKPGTDKKEKPYGGKKHHELTSTSTSTVTVSLCVTLKGQVGALEIACEKSGNSPRNSSISAGDKNRAQINNVKYWE